MSEFGDEELPVSESSSVSANPLDDDAQAQALLRQLISQEGLHTAWGRVGKRLRVAEQRLGAALRELSRLPETYVARAAHERDRRVASATLAEHAARLRRHDLQEPRLHDLEVRVGGLERLEERLQRQAAELGVCAGRLDFLQQRTLELRDEQLERLGAVSSAGSSSAHELRRGFAALRQSTDASLEALGREVEEREQRLRRFASDEVRRTSDELLAGGTHQERLLEMLDGRVLGQLRSELSGTQQHLGQVAEEQRQQHKECQQLLRRSEQKLSDLGAKHAGALEQLHASLDLRPRREEVERESEQLKAGHADLSLTLESLQSHTVLKLGEFVDHFGQLHEMLDDHEHCLKHHAEELENRSTKYDLLVCQGQIEKCALREETERDLHELQKVVGWQTNKIENFGLSIAMAAKPKPVQAPRRRKVQHAEAPAKSDTSASSSSSSEAEARGPEASGPAAEEEHERAAGGVSGPGGAAAGGQLGQRQLELLSMALVGLGNLLLRPARLGASRNARLEEERELLEQLKCLRHWISHRAAPQGWRPDALTTLALRCAFPRDRDPPGPLPSLTLKLGGEHELSAATLATVASSGELLVERAKNAPSARSARAPRGAPRGVLRGPLSARPRELPPL